jgi:hypothetical protein
VAVFTESVIRETFWLAAGHGAINLGQGFPDFACPPELKAAACTAIYADDNQYPMTYGTAALRAAIAAKTAWAHRQEDPLMSGRTGNQCSGLARTPTGSPGEGCPVWHASFSEAARSRPTGCPVCGMQKRTGQSRRDGWSGGQDTRRIGLPAGRRTSRLLVTQPSRAAQAGRHTRPEKCNCPREDS